MESLQISDVGEALGAKAPRLSPSDQNPIFYRRFAGHEPQPRDRNIDDIRVSKRLDRLYCHDASPYVYRGPFQLVEDEIEVEKWILGFQITAKEEELEEVNAALRHMKARLDRLDNITSVEDG